ncbi:hypothetical protein [Paracoccus sp. (in: a-proteobacteria)]|uniref:hypothetical protein n=1 Tax=Paracoccus sp. TaxID=267 RepID=UPI00289C1D0C|nr:hypothetical protein [Paracoccus sp. (in: a-proteobacteria)]
MHTPYDNAKVAQLLAGKNAAVNLFEYLREGMARDADCGLLTALIYDFDDMTSCRVFSEDRDAYPVGNFKALVPGPYFEKVVKPRNHCASVDLAGVAELFFDWEKIRDLGFESSLNIPAVVNDTLIGTVNLLGVRGTYQPAKVEAALRWQPIINLCFLLLNQSAGRAASFHADVLDLPKGRVETL